MRSDLDSWSPRLMDSMTHLEWVILARSDSALVVDKVVSVSPSFYVEYKAFSFPWYKWVFLSHLNKMFNCAKLMHFPPFPFYKYSLILLTVHTAHIGCSPCTHKILPKLAIHRQQAEQRKSKQIPPPTQIRLIRESPPPRHYSLIRSCSWLAAAANR